MASLPYRTVSPNRLLAAAVVVLFLLALIPSRFTGFLTSIGDLATVIITPVSGPLQRLSGWLRPAVPRDSNDPQLRTLQEEIETLQQQLLRSQQENQRLNEVLEEVANIVNVNPHLPVRHLRAAVIGVSSDLSSGVLTVRAGRKNGVETNTVALGAGMQLLGKVARSDERVCKVQPITSKASGAIEARIMGPASGQSLKCRLEPSGDGTLRGPVGTADAVGIPFEIAVGQLVRLDDRERWPEHAQMLLLGRVEKVEPNPDQPLRRVVTVRPTMSISQAAEVILRMGAELGETEAAAKAGGPAGGSP